MFADFTKDVSCFNCAWNVVVFNSTRDTKFMLGERKPVGLPFLVHFVDDVVPVHFVAIVNSYPLCCCCRFMFTLLSLSFPVHFDVIVVSSLLLHAERTTCDGYKNSGCLHAFYGVGISSTLFIQLRFLKDKRNQIFRVASLHDWRCCIKMYVVILGLVTKILPQRDLHLNCYLKSPYFHVPLHNIFTLRLQSSKCF